MQPILYSGFLSLAAATDGLIPARVQQESETLRAPVLF
jgi:hypothetical protein